MNKIHNPSGVHTPAGAYSHAVEVPPGARWLAVSGQIGVRPDGTIAPAFDEQCELAFKNLLAILAAAGMGKQDIVKLTIYLTRELDFMPYRAIRSRIIGDDVKPASTLVFISKLARAEFLVEIECWAAKA